MAHRQVGNEAVAIGDGALRIGDLDFQPVDGHRFCVPAQKRKAKLLPAMRSIWR